MRTTRSSYIWHKIMQDDITLPRSKLVRFVSDVRACPSRNRFDTKTWCRDPGFNLINLFFLRHWGGPECLNGASLGYTPTLPANIITGNSYWNGRLCTVDLLELTSLDQRLLIVQYFFTFLTKQASLMRKSVVQRLPFSVQHFVRPEPTLVGHRSVPHPIVRLHAYLTFKLF